jgi:predicted nucleotidyltransferase
MLDGLIEVPILGTIVPEMGTITFRNRILGGTNLGDALFSRTQQRVLALLFGQPGRSFYAKELIRLAAAGSGSVQRELVRLEQSGLVTARIVGNQKHYQANPKSPIFRELCSITAKTFGVAEPLRNALSVVASRIQAAFIYGSVAKRQDTALSDIDLMVVADKLPYGDLVAALEVAASALERQINPTILSTRDFSQRVKERKSFVSRVLAQPKIWLIGNENDLSV